MKLPDWFNGQIYNEGDIVTNHFSGEKIELTNEELSMYDLITGAQMMGNYDLMQKGLDWFKEANPEAYTILLD